MPRFYLGPFKALEVSEDGVTAVSTTAADDPHGPSFNLISVESDCKMRSDANSPVQAEGWVYDPAFCDDPDGLEYCLDQLGWPGWFLEFGRTHGWRPNINWCMVVRGAQGRPGAWDALSERLADKAGAGPWLKEVLREEGLRLHEAPALWAPRPQLRQPQLVQEVEVDVAKPAHGGAWLAAAPVAWPVAAPVAKPVNVPVAKPPAPPVVRHTNNATPAFGVRAILLRGGRWGTLGIMPAFVTNAVKVRDWLTDVLAASSVSLDAQEVLDGVLLVEQEANPPAPPEESRAQGKVRKALARVGWEGEFGPAHEKALEAMRKGGRSLDDCLLEMATAPPEQLPFMARPPEERAAAIRAAREALELKKLEEEMAAATAKAVAAVKADVARIEAEEAAKAAAEAKALKAEEEKLSAAVKAAEEIEAHLKGMDTSLHGKFQELLGSGMAADIAALEVLTAPVVAAPVVAEKKARKPRKSA